MVDARVETEFALDITAFVRATGDADDAGVGAFGELAGNRADGAGRGRDDDGLPALRPADLAEPDIGGQPRHPEHTQRGRQRRLVRIELAEAAGRHRAVELPAVTTQNIITFPEARIARAGDASDDPAFHDR